MTIKNGRAEYIKGKVEYLRSILGTGKEADRLIQDAIDREESHYLMLEQFEKELSRIFDNHLEVCKNMGIPARVVFPGVAKELISFAAAMNEVALEGLQNELGKIMVNSMKNGTGKFV